MSTTTTNLGLFEYDPVADANNTYNITTALNDNWDKIDSATGKLSTLTTTEKTNLVGAINEVNAKEVDLPLPYDLYYFKSGKINSDGEPDLLDITDTSKVVFNVDNNDTLKGVLADGTEFERSSIADLSVSALADGNYNLFIGASGVCVILSNTIYRQKKEPASPTTNDVWLDTSVKPYKSYKYDGADWQEFNYVDLPQSITVESGTITAINNIRAYGDNQYDIGRETLTHNAYLSSKYEELTFGASGTQYIAPADGWFFAYIRVASLTSQSYMHLDNKTSNIGNSCQAYYITSNYLMKCIVPASKGDIVQCGYSNSASSTGGIRFIYANGEK